jgi:predicted protein tyrosine phosphatase
VSLIVCPLFDVEAVAAERRPSHMITLLDPGTPCPTPACLTAERHLRLEVYDITAPFAGMEPATAEVVERILAFAGGWDEAQPMLIHCFAGISRSTATAFAVACARTEGADEREIARALRRAAPHANPNRHLVDLADQILGRRGRMVAALEAMGQGELVGMGQPFDFAPWRR